MSEAFRSDRPGKVTFSHIVNLGSRLTERDRQIALDCYEHHVFTTEQLQRLHFSGLRTARTRLQILYTLRVLDRFRPPWRRREGSTPHHWILDEAGAHIVAELHGIERRELRWRHSTALALAGSVKLRHHLQVNEFFVLLAHEAAAAGGALVEWYGERTTHGLFNGTIVPDGYGVVSLPGEASLHILLELDRATEPLGSLREKALRYARVVPRSALAETCPLIVVTVPDQTRARAVGEVIQGTGAPMTVAVWDSASSPLEIVLTRARGLSAKSQPEHARQAGPP
jgi:Replication-relaxation